MMMLPIGRKITGRRSFIRFTLLNFKRLGAFMRLCQGRFLRAHKKKFIGTKFGSICFLIFYKYPANKESVAFLIRNTCR